jgi:hypothetical protein
VGGGVPVQPQTYYVSASGTGDESGDDSNNTMSFANAQTYANANPDTEITKDLPSKAANLVISMVFLFDPGHTAT